MSGKAAAAAPLHPMRADLVRLVRLAAPVVAARVGVMTMGLTDTIVVGRLSATQLGFMALAWAAAAVVLNSSMGLLSGVQVMTSRALGAGDRPAAGAALRRGLVYGLWVGVLAAGALILGMPPILDALRLQGGLAEGARAPLLMLAVSMPSFAISSAAASWLEGLGRMTPPLVMMWMANVLNLGLDLVLVPGGFGIPTMGAAGATAATLIGRTVLALASLAYIALMPDARALGVFRKPLPSRADEIDQRRVGYGAAASGFFEVTAFSAMSVIAGWISATTVAAWAVSLNVLALVFMVPLGISTATAVMVAQAYGAQDRAALHRAAVLGFGVTAVVGVVFGVLIAPTAGLIAPLYTTDRATIVMAAGALLLTCVFFLPDGLQVVVAQSLRARGDVAVPTLTHLMSYAVVMVPLAYALAIPLHGGMTGMVWATIIAAYVSAGLLLGRYWMLARREA
ncbi:MAG TPA: MATE family efflux transporter [Caulobacteraceae bacterium]|jgi:MATE family multidrug resistance protein